MHNIFPLPHQVNMNRPPPPIMSENDVNQQRKSWIHNNPLNNDASLLGVPPPNFMGNFRNNQGGKILRGGANNHSHSPHNSFRGGRSNRPRIRGSFRGNFKSQSQW